MREFDRRPWGSYTVLEEDRGFKVKRIEVLPGKRLSYQKHAQRAEHWFVVEGTAKVTLDGEEITVRAGEAIDIPIGAAHRVENPGEVFYAADRPYGLIEATVERDDATDPGSAWHSTPGFI